MESRTIDIILHKKQGKKLTQKKRKKTFDLSEKLD
jgi:hypothetical protein